MQTIKFLGAAGGVTGSSYLFTAANGSSLLIDLGIFQGPPDSVRLNFQPLAFDARTLTAAVLTHAHLDHCGRLPLLVKAGFSGRIYATQPTLDIARVSLLDSAALAQEENQNPVLFTREDVDAVFRLTQVVSYDQPFSAGNFNLTFRNAGHILGSASIEISAQPTVVFSGDLGNTPEDLIAPTEYITSAAAVVMESTYGDSAHPSEDVPTILQREINTVEKSGAVLLIPAFSIERTQEIIHLIGHLKQHQAVDVNTPVYLDSPMAIEVMEIFKQYPNLYNSELKSDPHPFDFPHLVLTRTVAESQAIRDTPGAKVIIAGSGMMSGGRIIHHLKNYLSHGQTRLLIVGYQAEGTLGREIESGARDVSILGTTIPVRATITKLESLSSHADQPRLLNWLRHIHGVKQVFLTHGDTHQREALAQKIKSELGISDVILPVAFQVCDLTSG